MQSLVPSVTVLSLVSLVKSAGPSWWGRPRGAFRGFGGLSRPRRGPHRGSVPPLISMPHRCRPSSGGPVTPGASRDMALVPKCSLSRRLATTREDSRGRAVGLDMVEPRMDPSLEGDCTSCAAPIRGRAVLRGRGVHGPRSGESGLRPAFFGFRSNFGSKGGGSTARFREKGADPTGWRGVVRGFV